MLSRVSLEEGPGGNVPIPGCSEDVLDEPGTAEVSNPCIERMDTELSALPLTSTPTATQEELKNK